MQADCPPHPHATGGGAFQSRLSSRPHAESGQNRPSSLSCLRSQCHGCPFRASLCESHGGLCASHCGLCQNHCSLVGNHCYLCHCVFFSGRHSLPSAYLSSKDGSRDPLCPDRVPHVSQTVWRLGRKKFHNEMSAARDQLQIEPPTHNHAIHIHVML